MVAALEAQPETRLANNLGRPLKRYDTTKGGADDADAPSESDLVARLQAGDEAAFASVVRTHSDGVHRVASGMVGRDEADDVVQETFMRALEAIGRFEGRSSLKTWLYGIANRVALQRLRKTRRWSWLGRLGDHDPKGDAPGPSGIERSEKQIAIDQALAKLPDHQRAVVVLRVYEDLSYAEIAQTLGIRRPTAESRMARARQTLREELGSWVEESNES